MFIAALFMAKTWRQPKRSLTDEWIRKMWCVCVYIHTQRTITQPLIRMKYAICSNMDGPRDYHTKQSKSEKDKYHASLTLEI